ncbi:hypothetical protein [Clostridium butyricum]
MNNVDDFEVKQKIKSKIKENLSLKGYIYLINEYIELTSKINILNDKNEDKLFKLRQNKTAINVLKENKNT